MQKLNRKLLNLRRFKMKIIDSYYSKKNIWLYLLDLVIQNAKAGLRAEASRGYLGVLWWVIEPVMYMTVFYVAFAHLLNRGDENYAIFLLTGLIVWKWFHATISTGANSLLANAGLMNQVYVPKIIFPLTQIAVNTFKFLIILALLLGFLQFTAARVNWVWTLLPVLVLTQMTLIVAVTTLIAAIMPFIPDLRFILDNVLMMFLFLSGIFYNIDRLPENVRGYLLLNPMAALIAMYRRVLIEGLPPDWKQIFAIVSLSVALMVPAVWLFRRFDRVYPKIIF